MVSFAPSPPVDPIDPVMQARRELRRRAHSERDRFMASEAAAAAQADLAGHLRRVLAQLEPHQLGLYWPLRSEFNAVVACFGDSALESVPWALPYARRSAGEMHYRAWDRREPGLHDECGIPSAEGPLVVPDVVLVPCLGFTRSGYRLGYGGGYYDRWLAVHPQVTSIGVAWAGGELSDADLAAQAHDHPLTVIVTERGVV
jgi:5,10-methenyltetrahydrofolate synthetase